jgi:hypothetical protein
VLTTWSSSVSPYSLDGACRWAAVARNGTISPLGVPGEARHTMREARTKMGPSA